MELAATVHSEVADMLVQLNRIVKRLDNVIELANSMERVEIHVIREKHVRLHCSEAHKGVGRDNFSPVNNSSGASLTLC